MLECVPVPVLCLMVFFCQGVRGEDFRSVTSYTNESVILPSDADPSWHLSVIRWSIYENLTYISVLQNNKTSVDLSLLFTGRLELNRSSGSLTIKNVSSRDALRYRVDLVGQKVRQRKTSYVQLSVQERLSKPSIRVRHSVLDKEYCLFSLGCSSENSTISLYWESKNFNDTFWSCPQKGSSELVLWASFKPNREVTFDCIATADGHSESSSKSVKCIEPEPRRNNTPPEEPENYKRSDEKVAVGFSAAIIGGMVGLLLGIIFQRYRDGGSSPEGGNTVYAHVSATR